MNYPNWNSSVNSSPIVTPRVEINQLLRLVYIWMGLGLLTTGVVAWVTATNDSLFTLATNPAILFPAMIVELGLVFALSLGISRRWLTPGGAVAMFFVYSALNGFTLSLLLAYALDGQQGALYSAFFTAAGLFGAMTMFAYTTRMDLTQWGTFFYMGLIGLLVAIFVNLLIGSGPLDVAISFFGVVLFTALTAYDTQKIQRMSMMAELQSDNGLAMKLSIMGALILYLDFINLFIFLLRLFLRRD